ncbi:MAG: hypothetical protein K2N94_14405 [Lachnospiraceae bacterium]|nr:hypothetical protein [Lachnospiraceae bacterium]
MEKEYGIPVDNAIREDVSVMCNLSQGILEIGEARGEERGEARGEAKLIMNMYKKGYTIEQIADVTEKSMEDVRAILKRKQPVPV